MTNMDNIKTAGNKAFFIHHLSEWTDSDRRPPRPKRGALPTEPHSVTNTLQSKGAVHRVVPQSGTKWCTIWNDVGTYLTSSIDPVEKASLIVAFAHFKKEGKQ